MRLLLIAILIHTTCFSQVNDSLLYQLQQIENDTEKVNQLYKTGFDLRNTDPQFSYDFAIACEKAALKSKSPKHLAKSYNLFGIIFYKKGDYIKALNFQKQALALNQSIQNETGAAINLTNLGNIYSDIHYLALSEQSYLQALHAYNKTNNTIQISRCLLNIGVLKYTQKQFNAAIKQFEQALYFADKIGDHDLIASCYNNIGTILREQNKPDSALMYLEESLKIRQQSDNEVELADSYNNIANVYILLKNFNQASNYISMAQEIGEKYGYAEALLEVYHTRSLFYEAQRDFQQANTWLKKHYVLKDSLQIIEKENLDFTFQNETSYDETSGLELKHGSNNWLLIFLLLMLIALPLFLIRYKR
ncbi:MAG: luxQ 7 [Bacteroidetes bacterium]|jgi:tetratricopeptide (TPR) repeat protein|nr:luxQ 7 [Bacteroidota bacterium]MDF2451141.1 luxQ 7 [Bacteroidota bacterium]